MNKLVAAVSEVFEQNFEQKPIIVRAPGRVNLIGEHTDYNNGFVLPASIDKAIYLAVSKRNDDEIHLISIDLNEKYIGSINKIEKNDQQWSLYILGVFDQFLKRGLILGGFNCVFSGDIPLGAGLSSSAALESGVAYALNHLFDLGLEKIDLVKSAQAAENEFVGVKCGIMDQFASIMGKKNQVIKLDCQSLEFEYNPLMMDGIQIVLFDTNVQHSLASSEYNTRRSQCEAGVLLIAKKYPNVSSLRDANLEMLEQLVKPIDELIYRRCKYVVEENLRLLQGCEDLKNNDIKAFGQKMFATHDGLSKDYEVSCPEADYLIEAVRNQSSVLGARMMGGGFGGCTINLVKEDAVESLVKLTTQNYKNDMNKDLKVYIAKIEDGVAILNH